MYVRTNNQSKGSSHQRLWNRGHKKKKTQCVWHMLNNNPPSVNTKVTSGPKRFFLIEHAISHRKTRVSHKILHWTSGIYLGYRKRDILSFYIWWPYICWFHNQYFWYLFIYLRQTKTVLDSRLHPVDSGFQELDNEFLSVELGFQIPISSGILESLSWMLGMRSSVIFYMSMVKQNEKQSTLASFVYLTFETLPQ